MTRIMLIAAAMLVAAAQLPSGWSAQRSATTTEFRALSPVSARVVWAGGRGGVVARTVDGGATWRADSIPGAAALFITGIHGVDASTAYVLGTSFAEGVSLAKIFKTTDGGRSWTVQYSDDRKGVFFDGLAFWDARHGIAFGDPIDGRFVVVTTADGGATWTPVARDSMPPTLPGEAAFAASGRAITLFGDRSAWIGTGGAARGRVFRSRNRGRSWTVAETPIAGAATAGIFGVAFRDAVHGIAVGGDYSKPRASLDNVAVTSDGGATWRLAGRALPSGVRYGVSYAPGAGARAVVAVGPSGSGYSLDEGTTWVPIDTVGYNAVRFAGRGAGWAVGVEGRIARVDGALRAFLRR